jgi:hypothetical protein
MKRAERPEALTSGLGVVVINFEWQGSLAHPNVATSASRKPIHKKSTHCLEVYE